MARIFISHANTDNAEALALRDWLVAQGWNDLFLDIHPKDGLHGGDQWLAALKSSIGRCRAVLFCLSDDWCRSANCRFEFEEALRVGATPVGVIVKPLPLERVPAEMVRNWQLVNLTFGGTPAVFEVAPPPTRELVRVTFPEEELGRLRAGLAKFGLVGFDPETFPWPPPGDPGRAPYRGLSAMEEADAGVFYGRSSDLIRGREALITLRGKGGRQLFVILGASGAGKSSFLRAGMVPRLRRDDRDFLVLPSIRPRAAALGNVDGLVACLGRARADLGLAADAVAIGAALRDDPQAMPRLLDELQSTAMRRLVGWGDQQVAGPPTLVLPIDQAEELFAPEGAGEAEAFLAHIRAALCQGPEVIVLATIRSDRYELLQVAARRLDLPAIEPFDLGPVTPFAFRQAITRPAERASPPVSLSPDLVDSLIADTAAQGADPLPLLAFTLERLYRRWAGTERQLSLEHYRALGGLAGSLDAALGEAFAEPQRPPAIPEDEGTLETALEAAFIPALVTINEADGEPLRRIAAEDEIPDIGRGVVARLVDARLLVRGVRERVPGVRETTIEVAHEALLRTWPTLRRMLDKMRAELMVIHAVERSAQSWANAGRGAEWLEHRGERLTAAAALIADPALGRRLLGLPLDYLLACREAELARRRRDRRLGLTITYGSLAFALLMAVLGAFFFLHWREVQVSQSQFLSDLAVQQTRSGDATTGMLLALEGLRDDRSDQLIQRYRPYVPDSRHALDLALRAHRERVIYAGHTAIVRTAVFSPDGRRVATSSYDGTARVWDTASGALVALLTGHAGAVHSIAFCGTGDRVVTASADTTARVWDASTGAVLHVLQGHGKGVLGARCSADGRTIVTASDDGSARLWDAAGGTLRVVLEGHTAEVNAAVFSGDGRLVATASSDRTARIWDAASGAPVRTLAGHEKEVWSVEFSPDGRYLATASEDATARVSDVASGDSVVLAGHGGRVQQAAFSPDGRLVGTASIDGTARVWDAASGKRIYTVEADKEHDGRINSIAFGADRRSLATASNDGKARLFDSGTGKPTAVLGGHRGWVVAAAFSADSRLVLTASTDGTARLWDAEPTSATELVGHDRGVWQAAFSPDGQRVATAGFDGTVRLWQADGGTPIATLTGHGDRVLGVGFSSDGRRLVSASFDGTAKLWDAVSGALLSTFAGHTGKVAAAALSPDGHRAVTASFDKTARVWSADDGTQIAVLSGHSGAVVSAAFSPDGRRVVTASEDRTARIWDAGTGALLHTLSGHEKDINRAVFSPDGARVLTASDDATARLWSADTGEALAVLAGHEKEVISAAFSADGRHVVTASWDRTARVWDGRSGAPLAVLSGHGLELNGAAFSPDGRRVVTASDDGTARVFDVGSGATEATLTAGDKINSAVFSPDGLRIATASSDGRAQIWQVYGKPRQLIEAAKRSVARCLSPGERLRFHLPVEGPLWCAMLHKWSQPVAVPDSPPPQDDNQTPAL